MRFKAMKNPLSTSKGISCYNYWEWTLKYHLTHFEENHLMDAFVKYLTFSDPTNLKERI